jgi:AcrR family transcriptional regulator
VAHPRADTSAARDHRRADLITAARDLFAARGYHETTVDDITRGAGVAKGTFYLYFGEKREVYHEVIRGFMQLIRDIGATIGESVATGNPLAFFAHAERAAHELMTIFMQNRDLARLAYREAMGLDPELEAMMRDFYRQIAEVAAKNIEVAMSLGIIRPCSPLLVAYAQIGMVERALLALAESPADFPPPDEVVREILHLAFEGIRIPGGFSPFERA